MAPVGLSLGLRQGKPLAGMNSAGFCLRLSTSSAWDTLMNRPLRMVNSIRLADLRGDRPPV
jgi:hypothetical protein